MYLTKTAKGTSADKYLKQFPFYTVTLSMVPVLETFALQNHGPSVYIHPAALVGGLGGGAVGSLGTYGISRLMRSDKAGLNAVLGGIGGTLIGHALGAASVR